jgi:hypothetical protein
MSVSGRRYHSRAAVRSGQPSSSPCTGWATRSGPHVPREVMAGTRAPQGPQSTLRFHMMTTPLVNEGVTGSSSRHSTCSPSCGLLDPTWRFSPQTSEPHVPASSHHDSRISLAMGSAPPSEEPLVTGSR